MVQGKKLYFKVSVDVAYCLSFFPWCDLVLVEAGVTKSAAGISTRPLMIINIIVTCDLALFVSSVSQLRSSSMSVTLLVFPISICSVTCCSLLDHLYPFLCLDGVRAPYI